MKNKIFYVFHDNGHGTLEQLSIPLNSIEKAEQFCDAYKYKTTYIFKLLKKVVKK